MKKLVRILSLSLMLSGIGMLALPTLAEAACCEGGDGSRCCGQCCESSPTGCSAGPCIQDVT
jgi:hypothetical protein